VGDRSVKGWKGICLTSIFFACLARGTIDWGAGSLRYFRVDARRTWQVKKPPNRLTRIGRYIFWISKTTLIGAMLDLMLGVDEERTGKRNTTKYGSNEMNMKGYGETTKKFELLLYTTLTQLSEQEQLLLCLLYAPPAKHVYLASRLLPGSQTVCPHLRLCSLD